MSKRENPNEGARKARERLDSWTLESDGSLVIDGQIVAQPCDFHPDLGGWNEGVYNLRLASRAPSLRELAIRFMGTVEDLTRTNVVGAEPTRAELVDALRSYSEAFSYVINEIDEPAGKAKSEQSEKWVGTGTGGGCEALSFGDVDGGYWLLTDDDGDEVPTEGQPALLGRYDKDGEPLGCWLIEKWNGRAPNVEEYRDRHSDMP
jgi:hypothetical protein